MDRAKPAGATQRQLIKRTHINLGHSSNQEFIPVLKCAYAKPSVLRYVSARCVTPAVHQLGGVE